MRHGVEVSRLAVCLILTHSSIRRGMLTPFTLPDGSTTCIGQGMPPLSVETVELEPPDSTRQQMVSRISKLHDKLIVSADSGLPEVLQGGQRVKGAPVMINGAVYRRLALASTDAANIALLEPTVRLIRRLANLQDGIPMDVGGLGLKSTQLLDKGGPRRCPSARRQPRLARYPVG